MTTYNWQLPDWPQFQYDLSRLQETLLIISEKSGFIHGQLSHLAEAQQLEALIDIMVQEAVKTSEIEGEHISHIDIRSSIKNKLGLNPVNIRIHDKRAEGVAEMLLDMSDTFLQPLTEEKLFDWHLMLLSHSSSHNLRVGYWRTDKEPMQIVSGHHDRWIVHFEAPPAHLIPDEMKKFIDWFNHSLHRISSPPVRAAIAHLYFESIHPFEDGNGRIGRVIAEKALLQGFNYPMIISLSQIIEADKKAYYAALQKASRSNEITDWINYFVNVVLKAQMDVESQINFIVKKSIFCNTYQNQLNERQIKVIRRMLEMGVKGFEGGMSAKKYMAITQSSKATATRDLQHLVSIRALKQIGGGRNVRYEVNFL